MCIMHSPIPPISPQVALVGAPVEPLKRLQILTDEEFERLVEAWADRLAARYPSVARLAGAGDQGLDVVGFTTTKKFLDPWDAFQCKRREAPLAPTDVLVDIGKVVWYVSKGHYSCPRAYAFACNRGIGTKLNKLLGNALQLKAYVRDHWDSHIATNITSTQIVRLDGPVAVTFEALNFSIFGALKPTQLLSDLEGSAYYLKTFGGGLPQRPQISDIPAEILAHEMIYVEKLRSAYETATGRPIPDIAGIAKSRRLSRHFEHQRRAFYSAESLREFSKDSVPAGTFEAIQQDVEDGIQPVLAMRHDTPLDRLNATLAHAVTLPLANNPLVAVCTNSDKSGVCHQLANDDRIDWDDND